MAQRNVADLPQLSLRASFEPSTIDVEKRTVQLTWTTGAPVLRGYYDRYWEELSLDPKHVRMGRLESGAAPLLDAHDSYSTRSVIGVVENATLEKKRGVATVRFDSGPEGEDAFRKVREGILRNVSVGYSTYKMQKVEGGDATIPTYRAIDWEPAELSMVPIGADAGAVTRSGGGMTPCEFIQERNMADEKETTTTTTTASNPVAVVVPVAPQVDAKREAEIKAEAARAERERIAGIQRTGSALKRSKKEIDAAVSDGTEVDAFTRKAVDAMAVADPSDGGVIVVERQDARIQSGEDSREKWLRGGANWIFERAAVSGVLAAQAKLTGEKVDLNPGEFRGMRLIELARQSLERAGVRTAGMLAQDLVGEALTHRSGNATTSDFSVLLETALHKVIQASFMVTPDTWTRFCSIGTVQDFRDHNRYLLGSFGALDSVNENGEYKNKAIPDGERQKIAADTKGNIIGISRKAIINDDMGAFSQLATMLGRSAKLSPEVAVYALLAQNSGLGPTMADGNPLFHASRNNLGTGAAIGSTALDADRIVMASQKDPSNNEILALTPAVLLVPIGLGGTARQINNGQYDFDSTKFQIPNKVGGLFRDIVDTARITGTRRYLFADANIAPTIEVAFLDGQQQPFMEMQEEFRRDGVQWKVRYDFGVAAVGFRGAVTNAGV